MSSSRVLVTGATGFIGSNLVRRLVSQGDQVTCLVRHLSDISELKRLNCSIVYGDVVESPGSLARAVEQVESVYHLAAATVAVRSNDLMRINPAGMQNVLNACLNAATPPTLVLVSSLAAVGPGSRSQPRRETDRAEPVSAYGMSKAACESAALACSDRMPISIVRPPIVLGDGDRVGLEMFRTIGKTGFHFVPGFVSRWFSVIHVADLVTALIDVAGNGKRLARGAVGQGIYFVASDQTVSYSGLGRMIGRAMGKNRTRVICVARPVMGMVAALNEIRGRIDGKPKFLNLDKYREAFAGSWVCSNEKIKKELGFSLPVSLQERLEQAVDWYRNRGWLPALDRSSSGVRRYGSASH